MSNNSIQNPQKMSQKYICLCQAISSVLQWSRWVGILPIKPSSNKLNHLNVGCNFYVSKFWLGISIILQISLGIYILCTTLARVYIGPPEISDKLDWHLMTMGYMMVEADSLISLLGGVVNSPRIAKLLEKISQLDGTLGEMRKISRKLNQMIALLFTLHIILLSSFFYVGWTRRNNFTSVTFQNILESTPGVLIRGLSTIFSQVQCALVVTMCVLISSKYQHLAETVKSTLEHACFYPVNNENKNDKKIKTATVKWMTADHNTSSAIHLEHISDQHQAANHCLSEINHCFGLQLLVTFTANLFIAVYYLYRTITASDENFVNHKQQRMHCSWSLVYLCIKLLLYMHVGQKVNKMAKEPVKEIQRAKLLSLPIPFQQQIQCLILQWMSVEPGFLSAFNVINIGPWLLAPIVGNAITYLLVAIQFKITSEPNNSTDSGID